MNTASAQHHYNPDWLSDDALVAGFVARQDEFAFLRDELARAPLQGGVQHYLLVGVRGSGKTTLLKRLAIAIRRDADLRDHLIALSFPEELYQVKNLADFWWATCDALADELDGQGLAEQANQLIAARDQARRSADQADPLSDAACRLLLQTAANLMLRPVLLVDNLDLVFRRIDKSGRKLKDPHAPAYWALRETLSTVASPILIGGSVRLAEPFTGYDKAFYDFFVPMRLGKLGLDEALRVLERLADAQGVPEVRQRLRERPGRIETLFELTGGNLRALGLIFELLRQGPHSSAVEDFERLMDVSTPYYKARFEDLSEQAQVVMHALAVRHQASGEGGGLRFGHTAAEIGTHAGLPTNTVSAQLDILEREGLVEKSAAHGRTQYRIAEQMFRLWLQMRSTRRIRQNVLGFTKFLEAMFDFDELRTHLQVKQGASGLEKAEAVCHKAIEIDSDHLLLRNKLCLLHTRLHVGAARQALDAGNSSALLTALGRLLAESGNVAAALVSDPFVEGFLASVLEDGRQVSIVLEAMRDLGYETHARPLLLAFEAARNDQPAMLAELEPEIQAAAMRMFARLRGGRRRP